MLPLYRRALRSALPALLVCCATPEPAATPVAREGATQAALTAPNASPAAPIAVLGHSSFCIDIPQNSGANGTRVALYTCNGTDAQNWTFDNGLIRASNNRCLNVVDGGMGNNVALQIWTCSPSDRNMQFERQNNSIRWTVNHKCLDVTDGQFRNGVPLQLYDCYDNSPNQSFVAPQPAGGAQPSSPQAAADAMANGSLGQGTSNGGSSGALDGFVADAWPIPWSSWTRQQQAQGLVNNEQEAYVTDGSTIGFEGDTLVIRAYNVGNGYGWKSGKLLAPVLGSSRGYIEASINTPGAQGTWPAFWLMPDGDRPTWPQGGEIDIMEQVNGQDQHNVSTHFGPSPSQTTDTHVQMAVPNMSGQFHRYGLAWDSSHCAFYLDGRKVPNSVVYFPANSPFTAALPTYTPILNLAMGGGWPGYAPDSAGPQVMRVTSVVQSKNTPNDF